MNLTGRTMTELIAHGALVPPSIFTAYPNGMPKPAGERLLDAYQHYANQKRTIVFCVSVNHAKWVAETFNAEGIAAECVTGATLPASRVGAISRFESGQTMILTTVSMLLDRCPLNCAEAVVMLNPVKSKRLYMAQFLAPMRAGNGKTEAVIIDMVENVKRHGVPQ